jgi:hypothetical protein
MTANAIVKGGSVVLRHAYDRSWRRHWSRYSRRWAKGFGQPGRASVNTPDYDWEWLTAGAYSTWQHHRRRHRFSISAYDGNSSGFSRFVSFRCKTHGRLITCNNSLGDAIRYRP